MDDQAMYYDIETHKKRYINIQKSYLKFHYLNQSQIFLIFQSCSSKIKIHKNQTWLKSNRVAAATLKNSSTYVLVYISK